MIPRSPGWLSAMVCAIPLFGVAPWPMPLFAATGVSKASITGSATYRERIALTPAAVFQATLEDVSRSDGPADVIAQVRKDHPGQVPIRFEISYDPRRIDARKSYAVRASLYENGRLRFASNQAYPVLTQSHGNKVTILMRGVSADDGTREPGRDRRQPESALGPLPATFTGLLPCADCRGMRYQINLLPGGAYMQRMSYLRDAHDESFYELGAWSLSSDGRTLTLDGGREGNAYWSVKDARTLRKLDRDGNPIDSKLPYDLARLAAVESMEPRVRLLGMFRSMADAPRLRDCRSSLQWPVEMSDDYRALERAYTAQRAAPGSELLVSLDGRIEPRPKMEGNGTEPTLVVERFVRAMPGEKCDERAPGAGLENTRWRPIRIGDRDVIVSGQEREPWIVLDPHANRVSGSGGCNRIAGIYETAHDTLHFGHLLSTKMACLSMGTETAFLRALDATRRYRVLGRALELLDDRGRLLARLEERNLR